MPSPPVALADSEARSALRDPGAVALAEAASGSEAEARGDSLPSPLRVGCAAVTLAEMVSVSDTSVTAGERVAAAALPLEEGVAAPEARALAVAAAEAEGVGEGERAALREMEGEAVAEALPLGLKDAMGEARGVPVAQGVALNEASAGVAVVERLALEETLRASEARGLREAQALAVKGALGAGVSDGSALGLGLGFCRALTLAVPLEQGEDKLEAVCNALASAEAEATLGLPEAAAGEALPPTLLEGLTEALGWRLGVALAVERRVKAGEAVRSGEPEPSLALAEAAPEAEAGAGEALAAGVGEVEKDGEGEGLLAAV